MPPETPEPMVRQFVDKAEKDLLDPGWEPKAGAVLLSRPLDTSESAWAKVREIHARIGPEGRVEAAFAVSELAREAALAGLRLRNPSRDETWLKEELLRKLYGRDLAEKAIRSARGRP